MLRALFKVLKDSTYQFLSSAVIFQSNIVSDGVKVTKSGFGPDYSG